MSTESRSFRGPVAGTLRYGSPPPADAQPPLKKQRIDTSESPGHGVAQLPPEPSAMGPPMVTDVEDDRLPAVNPVSTVTEGGSSASKHASGSSNARKKQARKRKRVLHEAASPGDVLWHEVQRLIGIDVIKEIVDAQQDLASPFKFGDEIIVEVLEVGAGGTSRVAYFIE